MAIVSIVGNVDKRIIAIPLARGLSIDGKTAIVTDDSSYKRLYKDGSNFGTIDGIDIVIDFNTSEDSVEKLDRTHEAYKHIIFVSNEFFHYESDMTIACRGKDRSFLADKVAKTIGETDEDKAIKSKEVILTVSKIEKKDVGKAIKVTGKNLLYLYSIEETKTIDPMKDAKLARAISSLVGSSLGIPENTLASLMAREKTITTKELVGRSRK